MLNDWKAFCSGHKYTLLFGIAAFAFVILVYCVGLIRTLLLAVIVGAAAFAGSLLDANGKSGIKDFYNKNIKKDPNK